MLKRNGLVGLVLMVGSALMSQTNARADAAGALPVSADDAGPPREPPAVQQAAAAGDRERAMDLLYVAASQGNYETIRTIAAAPDPQDRDLTSGRDLESVVDAATTAGRRSRALEAAYGAPFSRATFHLVVARAYSRLGHIGLAKAYYLHAAESYESASTELSARGRQAAHDQHTHEFLAALGNVIIPILAGAAAHAQAEMMARQTGSVGVGIVTYPIIGVDRSGDYGAHYTSMSRASYFSALQIYLIIECYDQAGSPNDNIKCREMEKITGGE